MKNIAGLASIIALACLFGIHSDARAATLTVTKITDTADGVCDADCSLREAIDAAANGDTIAFSALFTTPQTISLAPNFPFFGGLIISTDLIVTGPGSDLLTISSSGGDGIFVSTGNTVRFSDLTITGANATGIENFGYLTLERCVVTGNGGTGIKHQLGSLIISESTITENTGDEAGGIESHDFVSITNSTISNNTGNDPDPGGGGIYNDGVLTMTNSTVSGNAKLGGDYNGGGIYHNGFTTLSFCTITNNLAAGTNRAGGVFKELNSNGVSVGNTIIAANVGYTVIPDVFESTPGPSGFSSMGYNLIGNRGTVGGFIFLGDQFGSGGGAVLDPLLDVLGDYGGTTQTHRLRTGSPAIDKGHILGVGGVNEDQRGFTRPFDSGGVSNAVYGDGSDIGAYELQFTVSITGAVLNVLDEPVRNARVVLTTGSGRRRAVKTDLTGIYRFIVPRNGMYRISAAHRTLEVVPQFWLISVNEEPVTGLNFTCIPAGLP